MRQTKYQLAEVLNFGLIKENPNSVNQKGFLTLLNIRPWKTSLKYVTKLENISVSKTTQVFTTQVGVFACTNTAIYKVVNKALVHVFSVTSSSNHWSIANFIKFVILTNGVNTVFIDSTGTCSPTSPTTKWAVTGNAVVNIGGQLVIGGILNNWKNLDTTYVAWSRIGSIDFSLSNDNESGFHNPDIGEVLNILPFEKGFLAFGTTGVAKYYPSGVTFGFEKIHNTGILYKYMCAGTKDECYFIDFHNQLWSVTSKGLVCLNYDWIFTDLSVKLFFSDKTNELWIQNSNGNYILNQFGLYQISIEVSGVYFDGTEVITLVKSGTQTDAVFKTSKLDFNIGGLKMLSEVYVQDSSSASKYVEATLTKNNQDFVSRSHLENSNGVTYPHLTGNIMSVTRTTADFISGEISNLHIQTIRVDGRSGLGWTGANNQ